MVAERVASRVAFREQAPAVRALPAAPTSVAAFLAATATKVAVYLWLRFVLTVFGVEFAFEEMSVGRLLMAMSLIGILVASVAACTQRDARMVLAWSSVAQTILSSSLLSRNSSHTTSSTASWAGWSVLCVCSIGVVHWEVFS